MRLAVHPGLDDMKHKKDLRRLRSATRDRHNWEVREAACEALATLGDPRAVPSLVGALGDDYWPVRRAAAEALGGLGDTRAVEPLLAALEAELTHLAGAAVPVRFGHTDFPGLQDSWTVRRDIAIALGKLGDSRAVGALVDALRDDRSWVRRYAAEALGKIGDSRAVDPLRATLSDSGADVRAAAAAALDQLSWRPVDAAAEAAYWVATKQWASCVENRAVAPLVGVLDDEEPAVRGGAVDALVDIGVPAVGPLVDTLQDPHAALRGRSAAAEALGRIGDARAVEPLLPLLEDPATSVRRAAAEALGRLGDLRAVDALIGALADGDEDARTAAGQALERLGWRPEGASAGAYWVAIGQWDQAVRAQAVEPLIRALQDHAASVREHASTALGSIGDARAIAPLSAVLSDRDIGVARAAARALVALYSSGKLDEAQRAEVLALRDRITFQDEVPEHEGVDVRDDRTIGVDFPV
jgi:HEAT repeat protein